MLIFVLAMLLAHPALAAQEAGAPVDLSACPAESSVALLVSPRVPRAGERLRVVAAGFEELDATLVVERAASGARSGAAGEVLAASDVRHGAAPYWWMVELDAPAPGTYRVALGRGRDVAGCTVVLVGRGAGGGARPRPAGAVWGVERAWDRGTESLYSAWIEKLFDDPLDAEPSWRGIGALLGDSERNLLFDHLGMGEDSSGAMKLTPDCADLPYFLRAYFAWKLGLPFAYSSCSRGSATAPPRCSGWHSNLRPASPPSGANDVARFLGFLRRDVADGVHSGNGRGPAASDATDFYPTRIAPGDIRPGTVYADPYGHTLVVVRRVPQTSESSGLLLAVDAQPDATVARKRYWRGNFLFSLDPKLGGAGFKNYRPVVAQGGTLRRLSNDEIERHPEFGDFSLEQYAGDEDAFYERVDEMLSPAPLDPMRALEDTIDALEEQVRARVRSVENGEEWAARNRGTIAMPEGVAIFETTGPWEDFSTPSRDLRLLIAIDVVRNFPDRVMARPERYTLPPGATPAGIRQALETRLARELDRRSFTYRRSDGSEWTLTLADVVARATALEAAYNPNDCVEVRWGAPPGSEEMRTCRRRAPEVQRARMESHREWFRERRRPPRR